MKKKEKKIIIKCNKVLQLLVKIFITLYMTYLLMQLLHKTSFVLIVNCSFNVIHTCI